MPIVDEITGNRSYPLPHPDNNLSDDVERLRDALSAIDLDMASVLVALAGKAAILHTHGISDITGLATALLGKAAVDHVHALNDLTDVDVAVSTNGQVLKRVGTQWVSASLQIGDIAALETALAGKVALNGTAAVIPRGTTDQRPSAGATDALFRFNSTLGIFEGWNGSAWGKIGGGAPAQDTPPLNAQPDDLWFSSALGVLFIYYFDGDSSQWVSTSAGLDPSLLLLKANNLSDLASAAAARANLVVPFELIEQKSPTAAQASIDFTTLPAGFDRFRLEVDGLGVTADDSMIFMQVQTGGATFQTSGYAYIGQLIGQSSNVHFSAVSEGGGGNIPLGTYGVGNKVGNVIGESLSSSVEFNAKSTTDRRRFRISSDWSRPDGAELGATMIGTYGSNAAITGVRLQVGSSTFKAQGNVKLFGIRS